MYTKSLSNPRQLTVFISSTYADLQPHREKIEEILNRIEGRFRSMRFFGSREGDPLKECIDKLRECNYYLAVIGHRYGSIHPDSRLSFTELEYEEAKRLEISRHIYIASEKVTLQAAHVEPDETRKQLDLFKQKLKKENAIVPFDSPEDLAAKVVSDILLNLSQRPGIVSFAKKTYLPAIRSTCASISFLGLDIQTMKRHKDVKLERVYVQSKFGYRGGDTENPVGPEGLSGEPISQISSKLSPESLSLTQSLSRANNLVVLGDPGSGKSTLGKYVVTALVDGEPDITRAIRAKLPIRIPLRAYGEFRQRSGGIGITILDFIIGSAKTELQLGALPEGFFEFYLERGDCILIFDGLDEIVDSHLREKVKNDIVTFATVSYPGNHTVTTSRKVGYEEVAFPTPSFGPTEILPFDDGQITEYINKWYRLEESDKGKRDSELEAFQKARENLPKELLSNPLLLSLIVILFRSGCTLPESKLEIYRSCIGTLTEKWDAAGKRLELPEKYNRVRDKKNAFARIAYWMYKQQSSGTSDHRRLKYADVLGELTRYLCEREFKGAESDAPQVAEDFLEYSAKRSIFIEDRFSHKTFHEYFAALFLYRNFCLGKTPDELYLEIKPYLGSDAWAVVLELLLLMLDEQSGQLLDALIGKIIDDVRIAPSTFYSLLLVPLRTLAQLQNMGREQVEQLISIAVEICTEIPLSEPWVRNTKPAKELSYQRVFSAIEKLPANLYPLLVKNLRRIAERVEDRSGLLPVIAFQYEFNPNLGAKLEDLIPNWDAVRGDLARMHLTAFYAQVLSSEARVSQRIEKFIECFGRERLFQETDCFLRAGFYFYPLAEYTLRVISSALEKLSYDALVEDLLTVQDSDFLLSGLIARSYSVTDFRRAPAPEMPFEHFCKKHQDPRKYLIDWLIIVRIIRSQAHRQAPSSTATAKLRSAVRKGNAVQKFYGGVLLGRKMKAPAMALLQVGPLTYKCLQEIGEAASTRKEESAADNVQAALASVSLKPSV